FRRQRARAVGLAAVAGERDELHVWCARIGLQPSRELVAVHARQPDVEDGELGQELLEHGERAGAVAHGAGIEADFVEQLREGPGRIDPELREGSEAEDGGGVINRPRPGFHNGKFPKKPLDVPVVESSSVAGTNPELGLSFDALNHRQQRLANGGNQFSLEPPDQGLCVGNGFVLEAINSVARVWDTAGTPLTGVMDLNTFFGYPAAIDRATYPGPNSIGPNVIDPQCYYDPDNNRFIVDITTLPVDANGAFNGKNTIDVAVSNTGDPTGTWTIYHVPAQNDGTDGTPNHGCTLDGTTPGPCIQDYPHIAGDRWGVYITTNEYDLFGPKFNAAQIFAFSKAQLAAHPASIAVTLVENLSVDGSPGFTVWPASSPVGQYATEANGTEYFLSTITGDGSETGNPTGTARRIGLWALTNTKSLDSASPALGLTSRLINSEPYAFPPKSDQKVGPTPLRDCLNDTSDLFGTDPTFGPLGCWFLFFDPPATWQPEVEAAIDSNDGRMQQTWYTNGVLWGATDTAVNVGGEVRAGIAWFAVAPKINGAGKVEGKVKQQGYLALAGNNLTYPAIAMGTDGKGAIAFTVVGSDYFPSAGYATIDADGSVGQVHIAAAGVGPDDGFSGYKAFPPSRSRWGDYGAAVTDGSTIWIASEYINQSCTLEEYLFGGPIGSCGRTRSALANWGTRISSLNR
ncbi:MAG TPA: hypothetical protein VIV06_04595, partial [Candidatus Limnocylindrales bacterium]